MFADEEAFAPRRRSGHVAVAGVEAWHPGQREFTPVRRDRPIMLDLTGGGRSRGAQAHPRHESSAIRR